MSEPAPSPQKPTSSPQGKKLLEQLSDAIRAKHYSYRTEQTYIEWCRRYILYHNKRHPAEMGVPEIQAYITYLAAERNIAASTQNQALSAILFLYRHVLLQKIEFPTDLIRAKKPNRLPTVLSKDEAIAVIQKMNGIPKLMTQLLFGSGLRLMECLRLRIKDIDFANHQTCAELVEVLLSVMAREKVIALFPFPKASPQPSRDTSKTSNKSTKQTSKMAMAKSASPMLLNANIPTPTANPLGNTSSLPPSVPAIPKREKQCATT